MSDETEISVMQIAPKISYVYLLMRIPQMQKKIQKDTCASALLLKNLGEVKSYSQELFISNILFKKLSTVHTSIVVVVKMAQKIMTYSRY